MEENYKLAKWLNDEMTDAELKEFQSEYDFAIFENIKKYSSELKTSNFDSTKILSNVLSSKKKKSNVISLNYNLFIKIAAVLVVGFWLFYCYENILTTSEFTQNGKKTTFILPDSSQVVLNCGSEIDYKKFNWDDNRNINLYGEAYFKVAKGKKFQVNTNLGKVIVLGTQFNVKARENRLDVTCFEGSVKVKYKNQEIILTPGETVSFENNIKIIEQNVSIQKPLWIVNEIIFEKEKLSNVIEEIQRQYNVSIDISKVNSNQLFTGKIPSNDIDIALKTIAIIYHLNYIKSSNSNYTFEK
ncbi:FecR family protein [Flavobacterium sp.]|uniref:FecR family protein n=1 Tax=Flavobacterium sp. TaxID=239 RepID=UPI00375147AA